MILKKIVMHNFRQYIDSVIEFSFDDEKNVTLVMGDNGAGKTTLAQAFLWCLYGDTDFKIKEVINRRLRDQMLQGQKEYVEVAVTVNYNDRDYNIKRRQGIIKRQIKIEEEKSDLTICFKESGNIKFLGDTEKYFLIKRMLPKELSRFFFFDGERIRIMSDDIDHGKSKDFKEAVSGLVGLNSIQGAIRHLKPSTSDATVIGYYKRKIDAAGDAKLSQYSNQIAGLTADKEKLEQRVGELIPQIESYKNEEVRLRTEIMSATPQLQLKNNYEKLQKEIKGYHLRKMETISKQLLTCIDNGLYSFISKKIVEDVEPELKKVGGVDKGIPTLQAPALLYLLKSGKCICGEPLIPGEAHFDAVHQLLDYVPPKSLGTMLYEVRKKNKSITNIGNGFFEQFQSIVKSVRELDEIIEKKQAEAADVFNRLADTSEGERAKVKLLRVQEECKRLENEQVNKLGKIGILQDKIERIEIERNKLVNISVKNEGYIRSLTYAQCLYEKFSSKYASLEEQTRIRLEDKINQIFPRIYEGGMRIEVDDKYNIRVIVEDDELMDDEIEKNTAQSYSVIFAFITSVIAMAKEKVMNDTNMEEWEKEIFREAEGYPLVMDAPLSNFDKTRIEQICTIIPSVAKQVVFFIKDTDGEVAEKHMNAKIGKKYTITKVNGSLIHAKITEE